MKTGLLDSGHFELALGCSIFATSSLLIRWLDLPGQVISLFRLALGASALLLYGFRFNLLQGIPARRDRLLVILLGAIASVTILTFILGLQYTSVANTNLLFFVSPVVTPFLAYMHLNESIRKSALGALLLAVVGVFLVGYPKLGVSGSRDVIGMALAFGGGCLASYATVLRKMVDDSVSSHTIAACQYTVAALATLPLVLLGGSSFTIQPVYLLLLLILGVFNTGFAGLMLIDGTGKIPAQDVAVLRYTEPVGAIVLAWLFLSEAPNLSTVLGGGLILLAGYLVVRQPGAASKAIKLSQVGGGPDQQCPTGGG